MTNQNSKINYNTSQYYNALEEQQAEEVVIIGAGLAGLTSAIILARAGRSVTLFEQSSKMGGRARTEKINGFYFNQGPHALYLSGAGARILGELGISYQGSPPPSPQYFIKQNQRYKQGSSLLSILTTKLLKKWRSKLELIRFFASLNRVNFAKIQDVTLQEWLENRIHHRDVFDLLLTLCRIVTYANDPTIQSAGATLSQLRMAITDRGVIYLDGGWQTLVNGLVSEALKAKAKICGGKRISGIDEVINHTQISTTKEDRTPLWRIHVSDGSSVYASTLIVTGSPSDVGWLFRNSKQKIMSHILGKNTGTGANPVRAACLDIALSSFPNPDMPVAFGIDNPLFLSVHSASAKLAPKGGALIHVMKYLGSTHEPNPSTDRLELETFLDLVQPGWRKVVIRQRFLPCMVVYNAIVTAEQGGTFGRPDTKVPQTENLYLVGDWVGPEGLLADASFASAKRAAEQILKAQASLPYRSNYEPRALTNPTSTSKG